MRGGVLGYIDDDVADGEDDDDHGDGEDDDGGDDPLKNGIIFPGMVMMLLMMMNVFVAFFNTSP